MSMNTIWAVTLSLAQLPWIYVRILGSEETANKNWRSCSLAEFENKNQHCFGTNA